MKWKHDLYSFTHFFKPVYNNRVLLKFIELPGTNYLTISEEIDQFSSDKMCITPSWWYLSLTTLMNMGILWKVERLSYTPCKSNRTKFEDIYMYPICWGVLLKHGLVKERKITCPQKKKLDKRNSINILLIKHVSQ